jgi:hypothetical protein
MSHHGGNVQPQLDLEEHLHAAEAKRVVPLALQDTGQYGQEVLLPKSGTITGFTAVTVTTSPTMIAEANTARRMIIISRGAGNDLFVGPNDSVSTSKGRRIRAADVGFTDAGPGLWTGRWWGRVASGTLTVIVEEFEA